MTTGRINQVSFSSHFLENFCKLPKNEAETTKVESGNAYSTGPLPGASTHGTVSAN